MSGSISSCQRVSVPRSAFCGHLVRKHVGSDLTGWCWCPYVSARAAAFCKVTRVSKWGVPLGVPELGPARSPPARWTADRSPNPSCWWGWTPQQIDWPAGRLVFFVRFGGRLFVFELQPQLVDVAEHVLSVLPYKIEGWSSKHRFDCLGPGQLRRIRFLNCHFSMVSLGMR